MTPYQDTMPHTKEPFRRWPLLLVVERLWCWWCSPMCSCIDDDIMYLSLVFSQNTSSWFYPQNLSMLCSSWRYFEGKTSWRYFERIPPAGFTLKIWACYVAPGLRLFSPGQDTDSIPFRVCQCFTVVLGVVVSTSAPYFGAPCWVCSFKVWIFCCTFVLGWYSLVHFMSKITLIVQNHSCYCWNCSRFQLGGWSLSSWPQLDHPKIYFGESLFTLSLSDRSVFAVGPFCCLWFLQLPVSFHTALIHRVLRLNLPLSEVGNVVLPQVVYLPCVGTFTFAIVLYLLIHVLLGALWLHCGVDGLEPRL